MKNCAVRHISMPRDLVELIHKARELTGILFSEFLRVAVVEKLERLGMIGPVTSRLTDSKRTR
jgi:hypothetical protein